MESPLEGLIHLFRNKKADKLDWRKVSLPTQKGTSIKQHELLRQDYVWGMLDRFNESESHYWNADFMKFTNFYNTMFSPYGGVSLLPLRSCHYSLHNQDPRVSRPTHGRAFKNVLQYSPDLRRRCQIYLEKIVNRAHAKSG